MHGGDPQGNKGDGFINNEVLRPGQNVPANQAEYYYPNDSSARLEWYHDHALGTTRLNAYGGVASAYIIRDDFEKFLTKYQGLPKLLEQGGRELPIVIQDKWFLPADDPTYPGVKTKGSLFYPFHYDPTVWELAAGFPDPPVPSCVPETFGDTLLVNGAPYPKATVDPRRYRLRILNACSARFMNLSLWEEDEDNPGQPDFDKPGPDWFVIGTEGGFLAKGVKVPQALLTVSVDPTTGDRSVDPVNPGGSLITAPAERWDIVLDLKGAGGKKFILWNDAPAPFPSGSATFDYPDRDVHTLLRFEVKADSAAIPPDAPFRLVNYPLAGATTSGIDRPLAGARPGAPAVSLSWRNITTAPLPVPARKGIVERWVTLNEGFDEFGRLKQTQGTNEITALDEMGMPFYGRGYMDPATETPMAGATEVWHIINTTMDVHPIHTHLVNFQLLSRQPYDMNAFMDATGAAVGQTRLPVLMGTPRGPLPQEIGWKETVKSNPGEVTTIIMQFNLPKTPFKVPLSQCMTGMGGMAGYEYVWHCHILDHEEHDMMRPLIVMPCNMP